MAVVGLGYWGPNLVRAIAEHTDAELRWICDCDLDRLVHVSRRYPAVTGTTKLDDVLGDPCVDAVLLATSVDTHHELARRCLEAGKHVFVEKPLTVSSEHALALIDLSLERELVLMCGHTFLYSPPVRAIARMVRAGELGELFFVTSSRVNLGLHQRKVSVVWDLGPHDFSILLHCLSASPVSVRAVGRDSIVAGIVDVAFVTMEFASGLVANIELSWLAPSKLRRMVLVGSKKMLLYQDGTAEPIKVYDSGVVYRDPETFGEYHLSYRTGDIVIPRLPNDEPLALQLQDFARLVRARTPKPNALALAYEVVRVAEAAQASLDQGGAKIELREQVPAR